MILHPVNIHIAERAQECASLLESLHQHSVRVHVGSAIRTKGNVCVTSVDETDGVSSVTVRNGDLVFLETREILDADGGNLACKRGKVFRVDVHGNSISSTNVKEHATLSAGASVDHGVDVKTTGEHVNRAADRGCCAASCWASYFVGDVRGK